MQDMARPVHGLTDTVVNAQGELEVIKYEVDGSKVKMMDFLNL